MTVALLAGLAMFAGDVLQTLYVVLLARRRAVLAGCFDGLADVTQVVSIGGGTASVFLHHSVLLAVATLGLIWAGSVAGAVVGDRLADRFDSDRPL